MITMGDQESDISSRTESMRIDCAFWLSTVGLMLAAFLVIFLVWSNFREANDIIAIVGLFTSILGTLVGSFFGLQIGSTGTVQANSQAAKANERADQAMQIANEANKEKDKLNQQINMMAGSLDPSVYEMIKTDLTKIQ